MKSKKVKKVKSKKHYRKSRTSKRRTNRRKTRLSMKGGFNKTDEKAMEVAKNAINEYLDNLKKELEKNSPLKNSPLQNMSNVYQNKSPSGKKRKTTMSEYDIPRTLEQSEKRRFILSGGGHPGRSYPSPFQQDFKRKERADISPSPAPPRFRGPRPPSVKMDSILASLYKNMGRIGIVAIASAGLFVGPSIINNLGSLINEIISEHPIIPMFAGLGTLFAIPAGLEQYGIYKEQQESSRYLDNYQAELNRLRENVVVHNPGSFASIDGIFNRLKNFPNTCGDTCFIDQRYVNGLHNFKQHESCNIFKYPLHDFEGFMEENVDCLYVIPADVKQIYYFGNSTDNITCYPVKYEDELFHTRSNRHWNDLCGDDTDLSFYTDNSERPLRRPLRHICLNSGKPVKMAGEIRLTIDRSQTPYRKILSINNLSGHYKPEAHYKVDGIEIHTTAIIYNLIRAYSGDKYTFDFRF